MIPPAKWFVRSPSFEPPPTYQTTGWAPVGLHVNSGTEMQPGIRCGTVEVMVSPSSNATSNLILCSVSSFPPSLPPEFE